MTRCKCGHARSSHATEYGRGGDLCRAHGCRCQAFISRPKRLGAKTRWGRIGMVGTVSGERYYWVVRRGIVSMMPAGVVEAA